MASTNGSSSVLPGPTGFLSKSVAANSTSSSSASSSMSSASATSSTAKPSSHSTISSSSTSSSRLSSSGISSGSVFNTSSTSRSISSAPPTSVFQNSSTVSGTASGTISLTSTSVVIGSGSVSTLFTAVVTSLNEPLDSTLTGPGRVGVIAGSALGGLAFILLLLAGALVCRRQRRRKMIEMRKAVPKPRKVRLEDEDDMDLFDPGIAFLGRPTAPSGSIFQERVWPPPSNRLEDPLRTASDVDLSSVVDDVMGADVLLPARIGHSRDTSLASTHSDTPLLTLANRIHIKAQRGSNRQMSASPASSLSSYGDSDASEMRSRGANSHETPLLVDTADTPAFREIPPLYHTIIPDPLPPSVYDDDEQGLPGHAGH